MSAVIEKERAFAKALHDLINYNDEAITLTRLADIINAKASGLLSHISIMFASTSVIFYALQSTGASSITLSLFFFELTLYVFIALVALSCLNISGPSVVSGDVNKDFEALIKIVRARRRRYHVALYSTFIVTIALVVTLTMHLLAGGVLSAVWELTA